MMVFIILLIILALILLKNKDTNRLREWAQLIFNDMQIVELEPVEILKDESDETFSIIRLYREILKKQLKSGSSLKERLSVLLSAIHSDTHHSRLRLSLLVSLYIRIVISCIVCFLLRSSLGYWQYLNVYDYFLNLVGAILVASVFISYAHFCPGSFLLSGLEKNGDSDAEDWLFDLMDLGESGISKNDQLRIICDKERKSGLSRRNEKLAYMKDLYETKLLARRQRLFTLRECSVFSEIFISLLVVFSMNYFPIRSFLTLYHVI